MYERTWRRVMLFVERVKSRESRYRFPCLRGVRAMLLLFLGPCVAVPIFCSPFSFCSLPLDQIFINVRILQYTGKPSCNHSYNRSKMCHILPTIPQVEQLLTARHDTKEDHPDRIICIASKRRSAGRSLIGLDASLAGQVVFE